MDIDSNVGRSLDIKVFIFGRRSVRVELVVGGTLALVVHFLCEVVVFAALTAGLLDTRELL